MADIKSKLKTRFGTIIVGSGPQGPQGEPGPQGERGPVGAIFSYDSTTGILTINTETQNASGN